MQKMIYHLGVDIGSTTIKFVVLDEKERIIFKDYFRHLSDPSTAFLQEIQKILAIIDGREFSLILTGSAGFGFAERMGVPHVQEVIACRAALRSLLPEAETAVELGGEDAKITWLGSSPEQRMNGVCAGGTGAFIDHMASLLGTDAAGLGSMAESCKRIYPIASRCGVFAKTDVQALINDGASKEDIAGSVLQAVVHQTIGNLSQGRPISGKVAFLGGPLHFLPQLRKQFIATLKLQADAALITEDADCFVAIGAALAGKDGEIFNEEKLLQALAKVNDAPLDAVAKLPPLFADEADYEKFCCRHAQHQVEREALAAYNGKCYLGIDSGSTTLKMALLSEDNKLLWSYYSGNNGNPVQIAAAALKDLYGKMPALAKALGFTGNINGHIRDALSVKGHGDGNV
ncbi:BadF/BadG/BcrA/BcrD ATPase family protein [uncultured Phascolarctobacterium sp.]|uniref:BadF/BadG/BcrA/BcrD ATPase family protein n=1 Tax=uncultured Phascolarctobacterium sp. TaxID=512296 RepID=UPI00258B1194|nr:BadF/BadG/BcrA/BcrD ATPase family protein [uncultured Phascolarctobacterium sp.]